MKNSKILSTDFASLQTLCTVYKSGSFPTAAIELDTTQSTVSYTIEQLWKVFDDALFFRQSGKMFATPRCEELVVEARLIIEHYMTIVRNKEFDHLTTQDMIRIASNPMSVWLYYRY